MPGRSSNNQSLAQVIRDMLRQSGMEKKFSELEIIACYREEVGPVIARKTREIRVSERKLILYIDSGVLKEEISYNRTRLIAAINERMGKAMIEEIEVW